uniref:Uncharacterized protein n=1 Tax=viral metagenome TaxID=1070528 RepID=A0A6C0KUD9_9ZZZZ
MPSFPSPVYSKVTSSTGAVQHCYTFNITFTPSEKKISYVAYDSSELSLSALQTCVIQNVEWWNEFISGFLKASAKLFSKPYTAQQIQKIIKHTLQGTAPSLFPATITLFPKCIQILGGVFTVQWEYVAETMTIDLPDLAESLSLPDSNVEEVDLDQLPVSEHATEDGLNLNNPAQFYDKQKVKESRLKAKLAVYRAQQQMNQYYEKYGTEPSDSDTDSSESEQSEDEEIQL